MVCFVDVDNVRRHIHHYVVYSSFLDLNEFQGTSKGIHKTQKSSDRPKPLHIYQNSSLGFGDSDLVHPE